MKKNESWIDGLKGVLTLGIILTHYPRLGNNLIDSIANSGARGVQFFFVLSSFLIFQSLSRAFGENTISFPQGTRWIVKKIIKLLPIYYIALIASLLAYGVGPRYWLGSHGGVSILNIIFHFLFLHGLSPFYMNSIISVEWYIGVLFLLYLLAPLMYNKIKSLEQAVFIFGVSMLSLFLLSCMIRILMPTDYYDSDLWIIYFDNFSILGQFPIAMLGVIFHFLCENSSISISKKASFGLFLASLSMVGNLIFTNNSNLMLWGIICFLLMLSLKHTKNILIDNRMFCAIGKYSYGIYLIHYLVIQYVSQIDFGFGSVWLTYLCGYFLTFIISFVLSVVLTNQVEKPITKALLSKL